jgi:hypothetical protein
MRRLAAFIAVAVSACSLKPWNTDGQFFEDTGIQLCELNDVHHEGYHRVDKQHEQVRYRLVMPSYCHQALVRDARKLKPRLRKGERIEWNRNGWTTEFRFTYQSAQSSPMS